MLKLVYKKRHGILIPSKMFSGLGSGIAQFYCDSTKSTKLAYFLIKQGISVRKAGTKY